MVENERCREAFECSLFGKQCVSLLLISNDALIDLAVEAIELTATISRRFLYGFPIAHKYKQHIKYDESNGFISPLCLSVYTYLRWPPLWPCHRHIILQQNNCINIQIEHHSYLSTYLLTGKSILLALGIHIHSILVIRE